jgi:lysozyme family protein
MKSVNFCEALQKTLVFEGGYVNDPDDSGGETNYGITKKTAISFGYTGDMDNIPMSVVEDIYLKQYWNLMKCEEISYKNKLLAEFLFDTAVNCGVNRVSLWFQECLSILNPAIIIKIDGSIGPGTMSSFNKLTIHEMSTVFDVVYTMRMNHYISITKSNPKNSKFLRGWFKRTKSFLT